MPLLDANILPVLDGLKLITYKPLPGRFKGELRSPKKGGAIEFADFRDYTPGDDLRSVDWNIYARLERPYIKLFEEEEDVNVRILIDCSKSMNWGNPNKFEFAKKVGACLAYVALRNFNWASVYGFSNGVSQRLESHRGPAFIPPLLSFLEKLEPGNKTNISDTCRQIASEKSASGLILIISDLFDDNLESALKLLGDRGREVKIMHILSPQEIEPDMSGDLRLVDIETGEKIGASISPRLLDKYKKNLKSWMEELKSSCHRRGIDYIPIETSAPLDRLMLGTLRQRGLLS